MILGNMAGVPMFCILIVFFRLRAKVDLETEPQDWAKTMMILATAALYVQILTCLIPTCPSEEGKVSMGAKAMQFTMMVLNIAGMVCLYGGIIAIIYAIFTLPYKYDDWLAEGQKDKAYYVDQ